jgi:hypothetical protein
MDAETMAKEKWECTHLTEDLQAMASFARPRETNSRVQCKNMSMVPKTMFILLLGD